MYFLGKTLHYTVFWPIALLVGVFMYIFNKEWRDAVNKVPPDDFSETDDFDYGN